VAPPRAPRHVLLALGVLLRDLLLLDRVRVLLAEDEVRDRDVIEQEREVLRGRNWVGAARRRGGASERAG
jgi:hypothetical protein